MMPLPSITVKMSDAFCTMARKRASLRTNSASARFKSVMSTTWLRTRGPDSVWSNETLSSPVPTDPSGRRNTGLPSSDAQPKA